jgi:hypothetical protein
MCFLDLMHRDGGDALVFRERQAVQAIALQAQARIRFAQAARHLRHVK